MKKYFKLSLGIAMVLGSLLINKSAMAVVPWHSASTFIGNGALIGGTVNWSNPGNASSSNDVYATAILGDGSPTGQDSRYLEATNFGFSIPPGAVINGIQVNVERAASGAGTINDNSVRLIKNGSIVGSDYSSSTDWGTTDQNVVYGVGTTDKWGTTWTAADINNSAFGLAFSAHHHGSVHIDRTARVDSITMTVYYTPDTTAPTASITSPSSGAHLRGITTINANATDSGAGVAKVEFWYASIGTKIGEDTSAPYSISWDTTTATDGGHNLWVVAYDNASNATTSASVSVIVDNTPPVITPPVDQTFEATGPLTSPTFVPATATDNLDPSPVINYTPTSFGLGTTTVTWTATDETGNSSATTSNVIIKDTTPPLISLNGNNPFDMFVNNDYSVLNPNPDFSAIDLVDGNLTSSAIVTGKDFDSGVLGASYTITYSSYDLSGNGATTTRTVNVVDKTKPIIYRNGPSPVTTEGGSVYSDAGARAIDRDGSDITSSIVTVNPVNIHTVGTYVVTYDVTGADLGTTTGTSTADQAMRTVHVVDTTAPTITLNGSNPMLLKVGDIYTDPGATSTDNIDPDKTLSGTPASVDTGSAGTTTVTYTDTDSSHNSATTTRTVVVRALGTDASLSSLSLSAGSLNPTFSSSIVSYVVELPYGTTEVPIIHAITTDPFATSTLTQAVSITSATTSDRTATVFVTSENTLVHSTTTVVFSVASQSGGSGGGGGPIIVVTPTPGLGTGTQPPEIVVLGSSGQGAGTSTVTGTSEATSTTGEVLGVSVFKFNRNLRFGDRNNDVVELQKRLTSEDLFNASITGYFGVLTRSAVIKYQEKYASEILAPLGLTRGTGFVGPYTRAKLNQ